MGCMELYAQPAFDSVTKRFDRYRVNHLSEKLYVHTDKAFYTAGEIVWFKLYAVDAQLHRPLDLSKVGYVELLSRDNKPVMQAKIALGEGTGNGSFRLPYSVQSGVYRLRAYTNWMKNGTAAEFFEKNITVINTLKKPEWPVETTASFDLQFFPEGGELVNGVQSKVACKITDDEGRGIDGKGAILNHRNDTVAVFTTLRFGMGHFEMLPDAGEQYRAVFTTASGKKVSKSFLPVKTTGIVMRLTETDKDKLLLRIQSKLAGQTVSLLVHTRQSVKLALTRELFDGVTEIEIAKKQLGEGISHFTVFDAAGRPVCERLYFIQPLGMSVDLHTDATTYGLRKKVMVDLSGADEKQYPIQGNFSVSVYQLDSLQSFESADIRSYFWLQSDLRGNIESPAFYFSGNGPEVNEAADNLMLTQGWRRFTWETVLQKPNAVPEFLPEIEGHIIQAKLLNKHNGQPTGNIAAYLSVPTEKALFAATMSDQNGNARFVMKHFYGGNEVVVQTNNGADSMYRIDISSPFSEKFTDRPVPQFRFSEKLAGALSAHSIAVQVGNTYYSDRQQQFLYPKAMDTLPFYGVPDKRYYLDDYTRFITMEEVMREYVEDVRVRKSNEQFSYRIRNKAFDRFFETAPLVLMDGIPVSDVTKIIAFDPLKIKRIDVVAQRFYQNQLAHDGIISYSTYQGDLAGFQLDANALIVEYAGLQLQREFYSPAYDQATSNNRLPDLRRLLYWSPDLQTGADGKKQFSFYTGDTPGTYGIVLEGISPNGLTGSRQLTFSVVK